MDVDPRVRCVEAEQTIRELKIALARQLELTDEARRRADALEDASRMAWRILAGWPASHPIGPVDTGKDL